jgi:acyl carrier protein
MGGAPLHSDKALASLEQLLLSDRSGLGVLDLDWKSLRRFLPSSGHAKFAELSSLYCNDGDDDELTDSMLRLTELSDSELRSVVAAILRQEVGQILRMQPDKIAPERSLHDMGLDSLMGVELVTALEARFGVQLPVMVLAEGPTIAKLTGWVVAHIRGGEQLDGDDTLRDQVANMARLHAADVSETALDDIVTGISTTITERMID